MKRLLLFLVLSLTFFILRLAPGEPAARIDNPSIPADYQEQLADGRARQRQGKVSALRYAVRTELLGTTREGEKGAALRLLGLEGDLEVDVDPRLGSPVQVRGDLPRLGAVTVRLERVQLRSNAARPSLPR